MWCSSQGHGCLTSPLFLSLLSLWHTLPVSRPLSHLPLGCRTLPQQMQVCRCLSALLFIPSFSLSPLLSPLLTSLGLQLRGRAHSLSHEAGLLSFFKCRVVRERGSERKGKGGRKRRGRSAGRTDQTDVPLQDTSVLQTVSQRPTAGKTNSFTVKQQKL